MTTRQQWIVAGVLRVLFRLALFPWLTVMQLGLTMASQVHWLLTGMTFQQVEEAKDNRRKLDRFMKS